MIRRLKIIRHGLGSLQLTVVLSLLLTIDLTFGYICLNRRAPIFAPLNEIGLTVWLETYGRNNLAYTAWFYLLLVLLTLFGINTFVCTTNRVVMLVGRWKYFRPQRLFFKFAPHVMHYALLVILAGYLSSYLFAQVLDHRTLVIGTPISLPGTAAKITLESFDPEYYQADRLPSFKGRVLTPKARLRLTERDFSQTALLTGCGPVGFKGYAIFLKDFAPKMKGGGMNLQPRIDVIIRKDPGVKLYLAGILLFTAGMVIYLSEWVFEKKMTKEAL